MVAVCRKLSEVLLFVLLGAAQCAAQNEPSLPISPDSFRQIKRMKINVPEGRSTTINDIMIRRYSNNSSVPKSYRIRQAQGLLSDPEFDPALPTVLYAHGYVELWDDESVRTVMGAYLRRGGYNTLLLDWSNLAFGSYVAVALDVQTIGKEVGKALMRLVEGGLALEGLHLVGHSLGAHVLAAAARAMAAAGRRVPRLTGLDPTYPGFYPALLGPPLAAADAAFVVALHTDGGGFGAPAATAHADFWPNGGASQPGCPSATVPLTSEDFCSHWRSWAYWAEAVGGGGFVARRCGSYDAFLRGGCRDEAPVEMGLNTSPSLRGNFYLRTATKTPFALEERGAE